MKPALLAALVLVAACRNKEDERPHLINTAPLSGGDQAQWVGGRWEKAFDEDNQAKDFLEFRPPAEVESIGANGKRTAGKFVLKGSKLKLYFPVNDGKTLEMPLSVSPEQDRLSFVSANGHQAFYSRETVKRAEPVEDSRWLSGSWQKGGGREWLLFNPPDEVGVLEGKPAKLVAHGKYSANGNYVSVLLRTSTLELVSDEAHQALVSSSVPPARYIRGIAP